MLHSSKSNIGRWSLKIPIKGEEGIDAANGRASSESQGRFFWKMKVGLVNEVGFKFLRDFKSNRDVCCWNGSFFQWGLVQWIQRKWFINFEVNSMVKKHVMGKKNFEVSEKKLTKSNFFYSLQGSRSNHNQFHWTCMNIGC